jgi:hypothetical protein
MDNNVLIVAGLIVAVIFVAFRAFGGSRRPKQQSFRCGRCSSSAQHTPRTIEAWRRGKTKFFCNACHTEWLRTRPDAARHEPVGRSGCLSMIVLVVVIPSVAAIAYLSKQ